MAICFSLPGIWGTPSKVLLAVNKHDIESNILVEMQLKKVRKVVPGIALQCVERVPLLNSPPPGSSTNRNWRYGALHIQGERQKLGRTYSDLPRNRKRHSKNVL